MNIQYVCQCFLFNSIFVVYAIKNGREPSVGKYPHLLSLQEEVFLVNSLHVCSAVLIHPQWALSSAHCFRESESNMYHVMSGVHQLLDNLGEEWEQDIEVSNYTLGDGGSPLTCPDDSGNLVLAGLGSFTPYPCSFYPPAVFTRITYYRDWICDVTYRDVC
ncbi:unnamed protein product [Owenia fusiformis]|uniref:Peptidase S1 domain-containing protein n=1 Tax=Owenia fusiformis TaxID=6347 RepID=A0A8S4PB99_OWEFU|nr:unnamed protein product [Owenia fusiformis]